MWGFMGMVAGRAKKRTNLTFISYLPEEVYVDTYASEYRDDNAFTLMHALIRYYSKFSSQPRYYSFQSMENIYEYSRL